MPLVDTSVWVSHLHDGNEQLAELLEAGEVLCHPFVIGELACGHLVRRAEVLSLLDSLPAVPLAEHEEVLEFLDVRELWGKSLGYIDVHLLASALISGVGLWTLDKKLDRAAARLHCRYESGGAQRAPGRRP